MMNAGVFDCRVAAYLNKRIDLDLVELVVSCEAFSDCIHKAGHAPRYRALRAR